MPHSLITAACRSPLGKFLGALSMQTAPELAGPVLTSVLHRADIEPQKVDQLFMGQVVSAGCGQAPARQAAMAAGMPTVVGAVTVNKVCGSGLYAVMLADMAIRSGEYRTVLAGGMESMSQAPHLLSSGRTGWKFGASQLLDALEVDGLRCAELKTSMGCLAEYTAHRWEISRQQQDQWAARSHQRAVATQTSGGFQSQIVSLQYQLPKGLVDCHADECPRSNCSTENLSRLTPAFTLPPTIDPIEHYQPSVTAGNSSSLADGAAALAMVADDEYQPSIDSWAFRITGHVTVACAHEDLFVAPAWAVEALLKKTGCALQDVDLIEINEAFAAQTLACIKVLNADPDRVNVCGGAIALGHPLGCSGARILVTLIHALLERDLAIGIATLCLGGGEAVALMIQRV